MDVHGDGSTERALAASMRRALREARWSPDDDAEEVMATLERLIDGITGVVDDPLSGGVDVDKARVVFDSDPLGDLYVFAAAMKKTVDQQHRVQPPEHQAMSRAAFARQAARSFPYFHQMQCALSEALDKAFPRLGDADNEPLP